MGKGSEQVYLQRRYTKDQQAHDNILNIVSYQGNANQNEIPLHFQQDDYKQDRQIVTSIGKDVQKLKSLSLWWEYKWYSHQGKQFDGYSKVKYMSYHMIQAIPFQVHTQKN